jgi:hypothetical protein
MNTQNAGGPLILSGWLEYPADNPQGNDSVGSPFIRVGNTLWMHYTL